MKLSEAKNISKWMDKKLEKQALNQKKLKEKEKEELDIIPPDEIDEITNTENHENDNTSNVKKKVFLGVGVALVLGGAFKFFKDRA